MLKLNINVHIKEHNMNKNEIERLKLSKRTLLLHIVGDKPENWDVANTLPMVIRLREELRILYTSVTI